MIEHDYIVTLPSGTELSVEAALGDLSRAAGHLLAFHAQNTDGLAADLEHVSELLVLLASGEVKT